jgi:hypothetical protein
MPRRASERPAAYTRTRHLVRFLDQVASVLPAQVEGAWVERRLGLSGGDVRAFLQSLRVLGLIDAFGRPTDRLRQARARDRRVGALREGLCGAYPDLVTRWEAVGGLSREDVEDHFKVVHGLGATSAEPAAKLFLDLWTRVGQSGVTGVVGDSGQRERLEIVEAASKGGEVRPSPSVDADAAPPGAALNPVRPAIGTSRPETIARLLAGLVHIEIGRDWDADRINLVFDRLELLIERLEKE